MLKSLFSSLRQLIGKFLLNKLTRTDRRAKKRLNSVILVMLTDRGLPVQLSHRGSVRLLSTSARKS